MRAVTKTATPRRITVIRLADSTAIAAPKNRIAAIATTAAGRPESIQSAASDDTGGQYFGDQDDAEEHNAQPSDKEFRGAPGQAIGPDQEPTQIQPCSVLLAPDYARPHCPAYPLTVRRIPSAGSYAEKGVPAGPGTDST